jgi:hypothetical protein
MYLYSILKEGFMRVIIALFLLTGVCFAKDLTPQQIEIQNLKMQIFEAQLYQSKLKSDLKKAELERQEVVKTLEELNNAVEEQSATVVSNDQTISNDVSI